MIPSRDCNTSRARLVFCVCVCLERARAVKLIVYQRSALNPLILSTMVPRVHVCGGGGERSEVACAWTVVLLRFRICDCVICDKVVTLSTIRYGWARVWSSLATRISPFINIVYQCHTSLLSVISRYRCCVLVYCVDCNLVLSISGIDQGRNTVYDTIRYAIGCFMGRSGCTCNLPGACSESGTLVDHKLWVVDAAARCPCDCAH